MEDFHLDSYDITLFSNLHIFLVKGFSRSTTFRVLARMSSQNTAEKTRIKCPFCDVTDVDLWEHVFRVHNVRPDETMQATLVGEKWNKMTKEVVRYPQQSGPSKVKFHGTSVEVDFEVPEEACAPMPPNYRFPQTGNSGAAALRVVRSLSGRRSLWIHGSPGTGKDAIVAYVSNQLRIPFRFFQMSPNIRIEDWFWTLGFEDGSTKFAFGTLLKALVEGYVSPQGKRYPYMIVISDMDRATSTQIERLRTILDTDVPRVPFPDGSFKEVLPGTILVVTANTMGGGDETGRMVSSRPIDGSIINRFECKVEMPPMEWKDEITILKSKFPDLIEDLERITLEDKFSETELADFNFLTTLQRVTSSIRTAISKGEFFAEFSHRDICFFMKEVQSLLDYHRENDNKFSLPTIFMDAFQNYVEGLSNSVMRAQAVTYVTPHMPNEGAKKKKTRSG